MRRIKFLPLALLIFTLAADAKPKSTLSATPMSADQVAVYQAFLSSYSNGSNSSHINMADATVVLDVAESNTNGCLNGITLDDLEQLKSTTHKFSSDVSLPSSFRLVDPVKQLKIIKKNDPSRTISEGKPVKDAVESAFSTGILTLSEVAFDRRHEYAVLSFTFYCGQLCAHGETIVFQKQNGQWKRTNRTCRSWIS
jgi:hypothetical protein